MAQSRKNEILDSGWTVVVIGGVAHSVEGKCWSDDDGMIPLDHLETAKASGYEPCEKCTGRSHTTSARREDDDSDTE